MRKILFFFMLLFFSAEGGAAPPSSEFSSDFYKILGVFPRASSEDLNRAGQRVIKRLRSSSSRESRQRLEEAERALEALQDPRLRARYDSWLKEAGFKEEPNFYKLFGVPSDSPAAAITKAYQEIRKNLHPDKNPGDPEEAKRRFQELQKAHEALSNPSLRLIHDHKLRVSEGNFLESFEARGAAAGAAPQPPDARAAEKDAASRFQSLSAKLKEEESLDALLFNEQVFDLAKELEAAGGEANIQEAVYWYRHLAVKGHIEAARRLAPLLEMAGDMEEALYRYRQGAGDDSDREFSRAAAFRQAQIYLKGAYDGSGSAVIPRNPARARALFRRAFELGASREAVAEEYELIRDYEKAMEWRLMERGGAQISGVISGVKKLEGKTAASQTAEGGALSAELSAELSDSPIHQAIMMPAEVEYYSEIGDMALDRKHDKSIVRMLKLFEETGGAADWSAYSGKGRTPLSLAAERFRPRVIEFLISRGADQTIPDADGLFPIHRALLTDRRQIAYRLMEDMFDLFDQTWTARTEGDGHGKTPLEMALEQFHAKGKWSSATEEYLRFAQEAVRKKGAGYLSDEEFNRIVGKAMQAGDKAADLVSLLMSERKKSASADPAADKKPASVEAKPGFSNGLIRFWQSRLLGRKKCREAVLPD